MPKSDRILANLPPTFVAAAGRSALRALADMFGGELQSAENALVAVMRAHWAEFADQGSPRIDDLGRLAALYGIAPRADESVEEFRDHLLRHAQTRLQSSVTVAGVLRTAAETVGLHLDAAAFATWWAPGAPELVEVTRPRGADAATRVLGVGRLDMAGRDAGPAVLTGPVALGADIDLRGRNVLRVALDGGGAIPVDLTAGVVDPAYVRAAEILAAVEAELGAGVAAVEDGRLLLRSTATGPGADVSVADGPQDAAEVLLGLRPRAYRGADATAATITGRADLSTPLDLGDERYLRIVVDTATIAEVDCAASAADPARVDVADVTRAINAAFGRPIARDDGRLLTLTSPSVGGGSHLALTAPAAGAATRRLFGDAATVSFGAAAQPAGVTGTSELGAGVDLRIASRLRLAVDAADPVTLDIAGADPAVTTPAEIVAAINAGLGDTVAAHDGNRLTLTSPSPGAAGGLRVDPVAGDAAAVVLGIPPRQATGTPPATAAATGTTDLSGGVDLSARHLLRLALDGGEPRDIDLRSGVPDPTRASVGELAAAVNAAVGAPADDPVATDDGAHLILVSRRAGAAGRLQVLPVTSTDRRRFTTRAPVTDDAATTVFGVPQATAGGTAGAPAVIQGTDDLSAGVDLTADHFLRLQVGAADPVEIDLSGARLRAATPEDITARINAAVPDIAATDGRRIRLTAPAPGVALALEPPRARDALDAVLGVEPRIMQGLPATGVTFTGTVDLRGGVELAPDAALGLAVDGGTAVDVPLGDPAGPTTRTLTQLVLAISLALGPGIAAHDGRRLLLASPTVGPAAALAITAPSSGTDATAAVLGVGVPRTYRGTVATAAKVDGRVDRTGGLDPAGGTLLRIAVDGAAAVTVDLAAGLPEDRSITAAQIVAAINAATTAVATTMPIPGGLGIRVASPTTGPRSRLGVERTGAGDAAPLLFGAAGIVATGTPPAAAALLGSTPLRAPVDLSRRSVVQVAVDGAPPVTVDLAGRTPTTTLPTEILAALNTTLPATADLTADDRLRITSRTPGEAGSVELIAVRRIDLQEYPPAPATTHADLSHGGVLTVRNTGAAAVPGRISLDTARGVAGPRFADPGAGWSVRVDDVVRPGEQLVIDGSPDLRVTIGERRVPTERLRVVPPRRGRVLDVARGISQWSFTELHAGRFDAAVFDRDRFTGGPAVEDAVFDLSRFGRLPGGGPDAEAVFARAAAARTSGVDMSWKAHTAGGLRVVLPQELDRRFGVALGARTSPGGTPTTSPDAGRFGAAEPERYPGVVAEPETDPKYLATAVNQRRSTLVEADTVDLVPIGWSAVALPFRDPQPLIGGRVDAPARLYLSEPGLAPRFLVLSAAEPGTWGDEITVTARAAGPAVYDLEVSYPGGRFEGARALVRSALSAAAAAGVRVEVTRDGTGPPEP